MTPVSWLSKTREKGVFAVVASVVGSKPEIEAPVGAVTVSEAPAPPEAAADGEEPADADGAELAVAVAVVLALGAADEDAPGLLDAEPDGMGVAEGAGA